MDLNDAMGLLQMRRQEILDAINTGVKLPSSGTLVKLTATLLNTKGREKQYDITETALDEFIARFEAEQPGRHPPTSVRRTLLVETRHKCAICRLEAPRFEFHHIIEFSRLKHHDPQHM